MTAKAMGVPVSERAVYQRVNRRLRAEGQMGERLKKCRSARWWSTLGDYYTVDIRHNAITRRHVDLEALARELGALAPWERLAAEEEGRE